MISDGKKSSEEGHAKPKRITRAPNISRAVLAAAGIAVMAVALIILVLAGKLRANLDFDFHTTSPSIMLAVVALIVIPILATLSLFYLGAASNRKADSHNDSTNTNAPPGEEQSDMGAANGIGQSGRFDKPAHIVATRRIFVTTMKRLARETELLTRRGNLNLVIGVATTMVAIAMLAYMVLSAPREFDTLPKVVSYYLPRVTTVVFVEVFSFFFLRLYRNGLSEMRYYQDQLTELSRKEAALEAALATEDLETQKKVINHLATSSKAAAPEAEGASLKEVGEFVERVTKLAIDAGKKPKD